MPNKKGGKKYKKGKKSTDAPLTANYPHANGQEMIYAMVNKFLGGCNLEVQCSDDKIRVAHIPGSMRKREWIKEGDLLLISKRTKMTEDKECDVAYKYSLEETKQLKRAGEIKFELKNSESDKISFDDDALCDEEMEDANDPFKKLEKKINQDTQKAKLDIQKNKSRDTKKVSTEFNFYDL